MRARARSVPLDPPAAVPLFSFLSPFAPSVWWTYVACIIVCGSLFWLFERSANAELAAMSAENGVRMWCVRRRGETGGARVGPTAVRVVLVESDSRGAL